MGAPSVDRTNRLGGRTILIRLCEPQCGSRTLASLAALARHSTGVLWEDREVVPLRYRKFADSPLEEAGFEPLVPPSTRTAVPPHSFVFLPGCTGCDRFYLRERSFRAPGIAT